MPWGFTRVFVNEDKLIRLRAFHWKMAGMLLLQIMCLLFSEALFLQMSSQVTKQRKKEAQHLSLDLSMMVTSVSTIQTSKWNLVCLMSDVLLCCQGVLCDEFYFILGKLDGETLHNYLKICCDLGVSSPLENHGYSLKLFFTKIPSFTILHKKKNIQLHFGGQVQYM